MGGRKVTANGVFFDLFGTLLIYGNMEQAWSDWLSEFHSRLRQNGLTITQEKFARCCNGFFSRKAPKKEDGRFTVYELRIQDLCNDLNLSVESKKIKKIADSTAAIWQKQISLAPNAITVLKEIKQSKVVGLITNFDHPPHIYKLIAQTGLEPLLDVVVISGEVELKKPMESLEEFFLETIRSFESSEEGERVTEPREAELPADKESIIQKLTTPENGVESQTTGASGERPEVQNSGESLSKDARPVSKPKAEERDKKSSDVLKKLTDK